MLRLFPSACRTMYMVRMRSKGATDARDTMPATPPAISLHHMRSPLPCCSYLHTILKLAACWVCDRSHTIKQSRE